MLYTEEEREKIREIEDKLFPLPHLVMADWHHFLNEYVMIPFDDRKELHINPVDFDRLLNLLCKQTMVRYVESKNKESGFIFRGITVKGHQNVDKGRVRVVINNSIWQEYWVVTPEWALGD